MSKQLAVRGTRGIALAAVAAVAVAACGSSSPSTKNAATQAPGAAGSSSSGTGVFNLPLEAPQGAINPLLTADYNAMAIIGLAEENLISESAAGKLIPQLATSWTPSSNGLTWTIDLRPGLKFSNGKPLTPADVVWTFDQILAPTSESPAASSFAGILKSVAADGSSAVTFTLDKPYSDFPYLLTTANTRVLPSGTNANNWIDDPVSAGQFVVEKYTPQEGVTFKKNPGYWDASAVKLAGVDVKFYSSLQSMALAFESGGADAVWGVGVLPSLVGSAAHRLVTAGWERFDSLVFNVTKAPLNNINVRQAIAWTLNRTSILQSVYQGSAIAANDNLTFPNYDVQPQGIPQRSANPAKAKQLLSGISTPITFTITTFTDEQTLAETIQQQLDATGDFKVSLDVMSEGAYYASGANSPWLTAPVTITQWPNAVPAQTEAQMYAKGAAWNASHYASTQLDSLTSQYEQTTGASARQTLANQIAKIEWTDLPAIIVAFVKNLIIVSPRVRGDFQNGLGVGGGFDLRGISVSS